MNTDLINFAVSVQDEISNDMTSPGETSAGRAGALTRVFIDDLSENGEVENGEVDHYQTGRLHASGFGLSEAGDRLDLFVTIQTGAVPPEYIPPAEVQKKLRHLRSFLERALAESKPLYRVMEEALPGYDMALRIHEHRQLISRVRLHLFTDGLVRDQVTADAMVGSLPVTHHIWDIQRLFRNQAHLHKPQPIVIDLQGAYAQSIPCLELPGGSQDYDACLAIIPGSVLAQIYRDYGPRLLERNVRSFLQASGGINRGIRNTLLKQPDRFLAYNNGISATASKVEYVTRPGGQRAISRIHDFQVVNGGQTTASLHRAMVRDRADLSQVYVQAKISIVSHQQMMEMVPLISRYANSQNRIEEADLAANDSFHVRLEQLSHVIWAPVVTDGHQTQWFYERARGQYRDAEAQKTTAVQKRKFRQLYPVKQKFTKVDVARFINTWNGLPDVVSRGNQKNFSDFTVEMSTMGGAVVDRDLFQRLVALSLLFREAATLARIYPAYRANIVAFTIAWLAHVTERRLDLEQIWREQSVPAPLIKLMERAMAGVQSRIVTGSAGANVTEWCKKPAAWQEIQKLDLLPVRAMAKFTVEDAFIPLKPLPPEHPDDALMDEEQEDAELFLPI